MSNTAEQKPTSFTIIVDAEVAAYIEQENIIDTNSYMLALLKVEKARVENTEPSEERLAEIMDATPDASGYPENTSHFDSKTH